MQLEVVFQYDEMLPGQDLHIVTPVLYIYIFRIIGIIRVSSAWFIIINYTLSPNTML